MTQEEPEEPGWKAGSESQSPTAHTVTDTQGLLHSLTPTEKETEAERQSHKPRQGRVSSGVRLLEFPLG